MLNQKLLSFDFGGKNIHIAEGVNRGGFVEVTRLIQEPAPTNAVMDGRLEDASLLKSIVRETLKQHKITAKQAVVTIQGSPVIMRETFLPVLTGQQLDQAVRYEMEQYLPSQGGSYITEHRILEEIQEGDTKKVRLRMAALPKEVAHAYYNFLVDLRLNPIALDIHPNAVSKLFDVETVMNGINNIAVKPAALIDIGYKTMAVHIFNKGVLEYHRLLNYGSRDLDSSLAAYLKIDGEQAERKKMNELDLMTVQRDDSIGNQLFQAIRPMLQQWLAEIQKVLQYYNNRNANSRVEILYLYGSGSALKGLDRYMKQEMNLKQVERIKDLNSLKLNLESPPNIAGFLNAMGALKRL